MEVINWIYTNFWAIFVMVFVLINVRGVNHALKGGNGNWQRDEIAVFVILGLVVWAFWKDGVREHEWPHFSPLEKIALITCLIVIAKLDIKKFKDVFSTMYGNIKSKIGGKDGQD